MNIRIPYRKTVKLNLCPGLYPDCGTPCGPDLAQGSRNGATAAATTVAADHAAAYRSGGGTSDNGPNDDKTSVDYVTQLLLTPCHQLL